MTRNLDLIRRPGQNCKSFPWGKLHLTEVLKGFEGNWAHHPNLARAFSEKDTGKVVGVGWHAHDRSFTQAKEYHYGLGWWYHGIKVWMCWDDDSSYLRLLSNDRGVSAQLH
jgi:hypothetical protein